MSPRGPLRELETIPANHGAARQQLFAGLECWHDQRRRPSTLGYQSRVAVETQFKNNQTNYASARVHFFGVGGRSDIKFMIVWAQFS